MAQDINMPLLFFSKACTYVCACFLALVCLHRRTLFSKACTYLCAMLMCACTYVCACFLALVCFHRACVSVLRFDHANNPQVCMVSGALNSSLERRAEQSIRAWAPSHESSNTPIKKRSKTRASRVTPEHLSAMRLIFPIRSSSMNAQW